MLRNAKDLGEIERSMLASYAVKSIESKGRLYDERPDDERLCFQRDKDRVVHCKAFRRLNEKTQVFVAGTGDHYRTRLTHTLEVAQVSRDIARRLGLNEDLCEVIALAHDLGHPPFGHGGEQALNELLKSHGMGFEHNEQSRRIVEKLEKSYPEFDGLNLSIEVMDGLLKHQTFFDQADKDFRFSPHLEAQVVNVADEIAYTNHDIDDGFRSALIKPEAMGQFEIWREAEQIVIAKYGGDLKGNVYRMRVISSLIALMINDFCLQTAKNIETRGIVTLEDVRKHDGVIAYFSDGMVRKLRELRLYLYNNVYMSDEVMTFVDNGKNMIKSLFHFYLKHPEKFPKKVTGSSEQEFMIAVKDYIAGMTDFFIADECKKVVGE